MKAIRKKNLAKINQKNAQLRVEGERKEAEAVNERVRSLRTASPKAKSKPTPKGSVGATREQENSDEEEEEAWGGWTQSGLLETGKAENENNF